MFELAKVSLGPASHLCFSSPSFLAVSLNQIRRVVAGVQSTNSSDILTPSWIGYAVRDASVKPRPMFLNDNSCFVTRYIRIIFVRVASPATYREATDCWI